MAQTYLLGLERTSERSSEEGGASRLGKNWDCRDARDCSQ